MDEDEYVETSDADEREALQAPGGHFGEPEIVNQSPRKRLKLYQLYDSTLSESQDPLRLDHGFLIPGTISRPYSVDMATSSSAGCSPESSSHVRTPAQLCSRGSCNMWDGDHLSYKVENAFDESSQDLLLLSSPTDKKLSELLSDTSSISNPITTFCSNEPESHFEETRVLVPTEALPSIDEYSFFSSPLRIAGAAITNPYVQATDSPRHIVCGQSSHSPQQALSSAALHTVAPILSVIQNPPNNPASISVQRRDTAHESETEHSEFERIADSPRYPLRRRGANQLKPYTVEQFHYKNALRSNPDAIVKFRSPHWGGHRHKNINDGEVETTQNIWMAGGAGDDEYWEEKRQKGPKAVNPSKNRGHGPRSYVESARSVVQYPELLQDLPSTDEEEARELRTLSKEARKILRERGDNTAAREKKNKQEAKIFPLSKRYTSAVDGGSPEGRRRRQSLSISLAASHLTYSNSSASPDTTRRYGPKMPVVASNAHSSFLEAFRDGRYHSALNEPGPEEMAILEVSQHRASPPNPMDTGRPNSSIDDGSASSDSSYDMTARRRLKALHRMIPAFMVKRLVKGGDNLHRPQAKRQRSLTIVSDSDVGEDAQLLPGQTRTRRAGHSKNIMEIKGDTESSEGEHSSAAESPSDVASVKTYTGAGARSGRYNKCHVFQLREIRNGSGVEESSSDAGVDDEEIQTYLDERTEHLHTRQNAKMLDVSLIDWMLSKTRMVGASKKHEAINRPSKSSRRRSPGSTRYRTDAATGGGRKRCRGRQTALNFGHASTIEPSVYRGGGYQPARTSRHRIPNIDKDDVDGGHSIGSNSHAASDYDVTRKGTWKEKESMRRKRANTHGTYTFTSGDAHIITGQRKTAIVTVDIEDEGFHTALTPEQGAPPPSPHAVQQTGFKQRLYKHSPDSGYMASSGRGLGTDILDDMPTHRRISGDSDIAVLHSGISFTADTFIGKGWLHELIGVISSTVNALMPITFIFRTWELSPLMRATTFSTYLKEISDGLLEFSTGLPELEHTEQAKEWSAAIRVICQLTSWFMTTGSDIDRSFLRDAVVAQISHLISRVRNLSLVRRSMNNCTFSLCWFMVEMSARVTDYLPTASSSIFGDSASLLIQHLLEFGLAQTMDPIRDRHTLDGSTTAQYTAELWICLFHLLDYCQNANNDGRKRVHPFWLIVKERLTAPYFSDSRLHLEVSEDIWRTIFSLCALTQFSIHGMTTATSRLPTYWDLVVFALKKIRLSANPLADRTLSEVSLDKRDEYIGLITLRCFHLWNRWHWNFEDAHKLFNQIVEIFRSRRFANLRHETSDFPFFMLHHDWNRLSRYERGDSAFVLFLKLMVQAASYDGTNVKSGPSPGARKLLSLAIPVGSLPISKNKEPTAQELSMLYNRLSAIAIGIYLDPAQHASRISHARTYVNFSDANDTTRVAIMRGMMNLAIIMKRCNLPLDAIAEWIKEMAAALVDEFKDIPKSITAAENRTVTTRDRIFFSVQILLGAVRKIFEAYRVCREYPDPVLLASLGRILLSPSLANATGTSEEILRLVESVFNARLAALPAPERPRRPPVAPAIIRESQESQDEYGDIDLDFDDPVLLAALGDVTVSTSPNAIRTKEEALKKAIDSTQLSWLSWRGFNKLVKDPPKITSVDDYFNRVDSWLNCWLGCADILIRNGDRAWDDFLKLGANSWATMSNAAWSRRINLSVMLRILRLDPMAYVTYEDQYIEALVESLVSTQSAVESEFVSLLLSIDGLCHPLLRGSLCVPAAPGVDDFKVSSVDFIELRLSILQALVSNLATHLREEATGNLTLSSNSQKYVGFCIKMFSTMRSICSELEPGSDDRQHYLKWCKNVFKVVQQHPELRSESRLLFWINWERSLN